MQHPLQISRKIEYGLRAMLFLASQAPGSVVPFREIAQAMNVPKEFLAKILKTLARTGLVRSTRGVHGGYALGRRPAEISFLDVIEAVEGPVTVNVCTEAHPPQLESACHFSGTCSMYAVWKLGQDRMLEVYRDARLDKLAMVSLSQQRAAVAH